MDQQERQIADLR